MLQGFIGLNRILYLRVRCGIVDLIEFICHWFIQHLDFLNEKLFFFFELNTKQYQEPTNPPELLLNVIQAIKSLLDFGKQTGKG